MVPETPHKVLEFLAFPFEVGFVKEPEVVTLGETALTYGTWGHSLTTEDLIKGFSAAGLLTKEREKTLRQTGFLNGHYYPFDADTLGEPLQEYQAHYAAALAGMVARARGWEELDYLVIASASSLPSITERASQILINEGINAQTVVFYGQACAGAVSALTDLCQLYPSGGKRAVVVGIESLTGNMLKPENPQVVRTFGNGGSAIAFQPGKDIDYLLGTKEVVPDTKGITLPYQMTPDDLVSNNGFTPEETSKISTYYRLKEGAKDIFSVSGPGAMVVIAQSETPYAEMNGGATFKFFARNMNRVMDKTLAEYAQRGEGLQPTVLYHPASLPVIRGLDRKLKKICQEHNLTLSSLPELWRMDRAGINNISAGSSFVQWAELTRDGLIEPNRPILVLSMGVGAVLEASILAFH